MLPNSVSTKYEQTFPLSFTTGVLEYHLAVMDD